MSTEEFEFESESVLWYVSWIRIQIKLICGIQDPLDKTCEFMSLEKISSIHFNIHKKPFCSLYFFTLTEYPDSSLDSLSQGAWLIDKFPNPLDSRFTLLFSFLRKKSNNQTIFFMNLDYKKREMKHDGMYRYIINSLSCLVFRSSTLRHHDL